MQWTADQVNDKLNESATAYYFELSKKNSAIDRGETYVDLVYLDEIRQDFYEILYHNLCFFYLSGLNPQQRNNVFERGLASLSEQQLTSLEESIEKITEIYAELLTRLPELSYDPKRPFSNYLHATVAPRLKGGYERFIHDDDLKRLDKALYQIEQEHPNELLQEEKARELQRYFSKYFPEEKRSLTFFIDYLRGQHGSISMELPVGDSEQTLRDFIPDLSFQNSPELAVELKDLLSKKEAFFQAAERHYLYRKRKGKINATEFFQTYRRRIECATGLKLPSPEDSDLDEKALQKSLAAYYHVSESAISQEKSKVFKALQIAWEEVYA